MPTCPPRCGSGWPRISGLRSTLRQLTEQSRFYSKDPTPRVFPGDGPERSTVTDAMREAAERFAEPGYRALASHL